MKTPFYWSQKPLTSTRQGFDPLWSGPDFCTLPKTNSEFKPEMISGTACYMSDEITAMETRRYRSAYGIQLRSIFPNRSFCMAQGLPSAGLRPSTHSFSSLPRYCHLRMDRRLRPRPPILHQLELVGEVTRPNGQNDMLVSLKMTLDLRFQLGVTSVPIYRWQ